MSSSPEPLAATRNAVLHELRSALQMMEHCLSQLTEEQVWWRPEPAMNSIANLTLHVAGNLRQWIIANVGGNEDQRNRPGEFSERGGIPKQQLLSLLSSTVDEAADVIRQTEAERFGQPLRIQGFDTTGIGAMLHSVNHFRGHVQETVHMTRLLLGDDYQFDFVPRTKEQGAP